jgi:hypothetical protein
MADINAILDRRTKKSEQSSKMAEMANRSATGNMTSFSGVFSVTELNEKERILIEDILKNYASDENLNVERDLETLLSITSEVKAINNQAALLHGERIKKAHAILIRYRDGAFTAWLITAYGNRQTPYNLMQYYDFYESLPKPLRPQLESMPRQAIYTLASRVGSREKKEEVIKNYKGETKLEMMELIRTLFPLDLHDKRQQKRGEVLIFNLQKIFRQLKGIKSLSQGQKRKISDLLEDMQQIIK